jgi:hypothetical protein
MRSISRMGGVFFPFRSSASLASTSSQNRKCRTLRETRSVAIFSTNISAARRSILRRSPSQSSCLRHMPTVCGLTPSRTAISALLVISPVR